MVMGVGMRRMKGCQRRGTSTAESTSAVWTSLLARTVAGMGGADCGLWGEHLGNSVILDNPPIQRGNLATRLARRGGENGKTGDKDGDRGSPSFVGTAWTLREMHHHDSGAQTE